MKLKYILFVIVLFIGKTMPANEQFDLVNDCIEVFSKLNSATLDFYRTLENNTDSDKLKKGISDYNNQLVMFSLNKLSRYSNSEDNDTYKVATDLSKLISDLVKMNYEYLNYVTNSKYSEKELKQKSESLIEQNNFVSGFSREITLGLCMTLAKNNPKSGDDKQYSHLSLNQRNLLNDLLNKEFGNTIKEGTKIKSKTPFEYSSRLIYEFINLEWEFEKKGNID